MAEIIPFRERRVIDRLVHPDYLSQNKRRPTPATGRAIHPALAEFDSLRRDLEDERRRLRELIDAAWIKLTEVSHQPTSHERKIISNTQRVDRRDQGRNLKLIS